MLENPRWRRALVAGLLALSAALGPMAPDPASLPGHWGPPEAEAAKPLSVVTTTQDLASIAAEVGGDRVRVESLAKGYQDPHFVDAKPSYLVKLRKADLFVEVGRDLEIGWVPALLQSAGNPKILPGGRAFVNASIGVPVMELPASVSRAEGDVHPLGNPHYWLDPENGLVIAANIRDRLAQVSPEDASYFAQRYSDFEKRLQAKTTEWKKEASAIGLTGSEAVSYHRSWPYFAKAFGFEVIDFVEPKPGIPPAPKHTQALIAEMKERKVRLLLVEPYFDPKLPEQIARGTGAAMVVLPPSVGAVPEATGYLKLFDVQLGLIRDALAARTGS
jgi:ABC-type Zn uptake system ZnuABC Zn-binding protein ZnuA